MKTNIHISRLIGLDPVLLLHVRFSNHWTCQHAGVDLIPGAIQEPRVDEEDPFRGLTEAFPQVGRGASFFIHDAHLDGVAAKPKELLGASEEPIGQGDLLGPVLLGLHDVDGALAGVHQAPGAPQVLQRCGRGDQAVHKALGHLLPICGQNHVGEHVMPHIAHQCQGAARHGAGVALVIAIPNIVVHLAGQRLAIFHKWGF
mmetsp:Transcript_10827/g.13484  ORF Transcript_10827/g.13484 Transcript_10827/m.13484 type:complete len:201 (-) Transcript_10827:394-996(-)